MRGKQRVWIAVAAFIWVSLPAGATEDLLAPFATANRSPLVQIYGLPAAESAEMQREGQWRTQLVLDAANSFTYDADGPERVLLDGESHRLLLRVRWMPIEGWELGLDMPYISHQAGGMDGFIDDWHDLFGFPDGGRPQYPRDRLRFGYYRDGLPLIEVDRAADGIGDIRLSGGYRLTATSTRDITLRSHLKLPTGEDRDLLGSGSTDIALGLYASDRSWLELHDLVLHGSAGVLWLGESDLLDNIREDWILFGSATLGWQYSHRVSLKLQLDAHTAFYDSALTELGSDTAMVTLGGGVRLSDNWVLDLGITEDIAVDTAPDVVFHLGIQFTEL